MKINSIVDAIHKSRVRISDHADEEAEADDLTFDEIYFSVLHGEIIEDYPHDRPPKLFTIRYDVQWRSCTLCLWAYNEESQWAVLVTVYRPDPNLWINWRERKRA